MSGRWCRIAALGVVLTLGSGMLVACGSPQPKSAALNSAAPASITTACNLSGPPLSQINVPDLAAVGRASGRVGVLLPDAATSPRYARYDARLLRMYLSEAGLTVEVRTAQKAQFVASAQAMIGHGVKVLILNAIDAASGIAVERLAARHGVTVIDYDAVTPGGSARYYVSFDTEDIGRLQAQALVACLGSQKVRKPSIAVLDGSGGATATLFKKGAHEILNPQVKSGKLTIAAEGIVPGGTSGQTVKLVQQVLSAARVHVQGVLVASGDAMGAVSDVLAQQGLEGHVILVGGDADVSSLRRVITGAQSSTLFTDITLEAQAATALTIALMQGRSPATAGLSMAPFEDPATPGRYLQELPLPGQVITQANVANATQAGVIDVAKVCAGLDSACAALGVTAVPPTP